MLVKRLEIQGFKSFVERAVLEFGPGVSAIVGPNGAGKSNIADAVRWVLGEQNPRLLRCARMEDVIFKGSSTRRPTGFAEVVLVLDNEDGTLPLDFTEVCITRRLYRSGESEYLLNDSPARLRDITELLAGTGIGKEGYSIIGQGRIDEVLLAPPEARRSLFDEACGIALHRTRKREALSRLEEVSGRLERVSDIVSELEAQIAPLDRQAAVARRFVACRDELEGLELWLEYRNLTRLQARARATAGRLAEVRERAAALREREARLEAEVRTLRTAQEELGVMLARKEQESAATQAALRELAGEIRSLEKLIADREREAGLVREELDRLEARHERLEARRKEAASAKATRAERLTAARRDLAGLEAERQSLSTTLAAHRSDLERAKTELLEVMSQAGACRYDLTGAQEEGSRLRAEAEKLEREAASAREELGRLTRETDEARKRLEELEAEVERGAGTLAEVERQEAALLDELAALARSSETAQAALRDLETRKASLEASLAAERRWSRPALAVVAASRDRGAAGSGFIGVLGEEVEVPDGDRRAVEAALGRFADALVVRTAEDLRRYVSYLRAEGAGPVVVIPLDLVRRYLQGLGGTGGADIAASLAGRVTCPDELRPVVDYLLGGTVLAQDLDEALALVEGGRWRRAVTPDGVVVRPGGAVSTGPGASGAPAGGDTLARMREIRRLREDLEERAAEAAALARRRAAAEERLSRLRAERAALSSRLESLTLERTRLSEEVSSKRRRSAFLRERVEVSRLELPELERRRRASEERARELRERLACLEGQEGRLREDITLRETQVRAEEEELAAVNGGVNELKVLLATLEEQERSGRSEEQRLSEEMGRLGEDRARLASRLEKLDEERKKALEDLEVLRRRLESSRAAAPRTTEDLEAWKERRRETAERLAAVEAELARVRAELADLTDRERRDETRLARIEAEVEVAARRLRRDYGEDWESRACRSGPEASGLSDAEVSARVEELRREMAGLGVVNIGAIDEHRRLTQRVEFLRGQAQDLEEARNSLLRLVEEMDETMARRFEEAFLAVRRRFRVWVPELFGGGRGDLVLTDRDDLLESGVEVLVEPPSKKLQTLALLSAGERALAALALLLSFLEVRPSPFVLLDELDAPLDDVNVRRFIAAVLQVASKGRSQFILITHNKLTMEMADNLYGATMGEDGVSRLVSVRLEDRDEFGRRLEREVAAGGGASV